MQSPPLFKLTSLLMLNLSYQGLWNQLNNFKSQCLCVCLFVCLSPLSATRTKRAGNFCLTSVLSKLKSHLFANALLFLSMTLEPIRQLQIVFTQSASRAIQSINRNVLLSVCLCVCPLCWRPEPREI